MTLLASAAAVATGSAAGSPLGMYAPTLPPAVSPSRRSAALAATEACQAYHTAVKQAHGICEATRGAAFGLP